LVGIKATCGSIVSGKEKKLEFDVGNDIKPLI
jgi:hypothetical protein